MNNPKHGDLRIWHVPQMPCKGFEASVATVLEARLLLDALARYDLFQLENNIKPDYSNAQGLSVYNAKDKEWINWYSSDGEYIDYYNEMDLRSALPNWENA